MKKLVALFLCAVMALTVAACSKNETASSAAADTSSVSEASSTEAESKAASQDATSVETYTMDEFISKSQDAIDAMKDAFASQGLSIDVVAEENSLVYRYQYATAVPDKDAAKTALESAISAQDATFQNVLTSLKTAVPDAQSVIVQYLDADGSEIFSKEYK